MDPVSPLAIATAIGGLVGIAVAVGKGLFDFYDGVGLASREYEVFSQEVNTLASVWMVVQPCLRSPNVALSEPLLRTLNRIVRDTSVILDDLQDTVDNFKIENSRKDRVARHAFVRIVMSPEAQRRLRLKKFVNRDKIVLQRSQIFYATTTLNVVLAVIHHAKTQSRQRSTSPQANNEVFLLGEQRRARRRVEREEQSIPNSPVIATKWLDPLPQLHSGRDSPFDVLAQQWTRPMPQARPGQRRDNDELNDELSDYIANLTENLQQRIADLEGRLSDHERRRAEDQATIAQLRAYCEQLADQRERDVANIRRMRDEIDKLVQADEVHREELQQLRQDCRRLRTERNKQQERRKSMERDYNNLESELKRVTEELNSSHRQLDLLHSKMAAQQRSMPPSSYPITTTRRNSSPRPLASSSSGSTHVVSSRESSRDRRSSGGQWSSLAGHRGFAPFIGSGSSFRR